MNSLSITFWAKTQFKYFLITNLWWQSSQSQSSQAQKDETPTTDVSSEGLLQAWSSNVSDTLSRAALPLRLAKTDSPAYLIFQISQEVSFRKDVEEMNPEKAVFVADQRLEQIVETGNNTSLQILMSLVMSG